MPARPLAWSFSRHRLLAQCERAAFWHYFGSRGLGLPPGDPIARRAFALKCLTALPLVIGTAVHNAAREVVEAVIAGRRAPDFDTLFENARLTLNSVWRSSQPDLIDAFWRMPGAHAALQEIVYRGALRPNEIDAARTRLATCLANLCDAPLLADLEESPRETVHSDFASPELFAVDGPADAEDDSAAARELAWAVVDLVYLHTDPARCDYLVSAACWCVVDFKTARRPDPDGERLQLAGYALWLRSKGYLPVDGAYLGRIVDLVKGSDRWYRLDAAAMDGARRVIAADAARQRELMRDPSRGVPREKAAWALAEDRTTCRRCRFLDLCRSELAPGWVGGDDGPADAADGRRAEPSPDRSVARSAGASKETLRTRTEDRS